MFRLIKLLVWIVVITGGIFWWNYSSFVSSPLGKNLTITIEDGDGFYKVFSKVYPENTIFLKIYYNNNKTQIAFDFPKGTFTFSREDTIESILEKLQKGTLPVQISLTTLPWWNIFDIDEYLVEKGLIEKGDFIAEARNIKKYSSEFPFLQEALTLEGFLYPDTHFVLKDNFQVESYMNMLLKNFERKISTPLLEEKTPEEIIEIINLASIVEREEKNDDEKPTVAGILKKRYEEWWYIWADITACYAYELTDEECKMSVSKYIAEKNDYNTRKKLWLPKTPINNPSISSINAVIHSKTTPYYFYLHDKTGQIYYARTNDEHNRNKALYMR